MRNIFYWSGSYGLWCHTYADSNACAHEYGFANKHRVTNHNANGYCNRDADECARANEYRDSNEYSHSDCNPYPADYWHIVK